MTIIPPTSPEKPPLFIFLDEGGNLDFSPKGSKRFTITSVACLRPFPVDGELHDLRYDLLESGLDIERFHATEDKQHVRDRVFALIQAKLKDYRVDSVIVEKSKTGPALRADDQFYPKMMGYLLRFVLEKCEGIFDNVVVITDRIPLHSKRKAVEKAIKQTMAKMLPSTVHYKLFHHDSRSCAGLQIADYFNWAIFRKWEQGDLRSHAPIRSAIHSEFDIFRTGTRHYY